MFNKVATFRMLAARRPARSVNAAANDNVRNRAARWTRAPRLVCRWELSPGTGRPVCRWELDTTDEPGPRLSVLSLRGRPFHKTVSQPSYQEGASARRCEGGAPVSCAG